MSRKIFVICVALLALSHTDSVLAQTTYAVACEGGQGATTTTNIVLRNLPPNTSTYTITNVKVYNQSGSIIYNGLPAGMATTLTSGIATGFASKDIIDTNTGRITALITFTGTTSAFFSGLSANLETDSTGKIISRDTIVCR